MASYNSSGKICWISELQLGTSKSGNQWARMSLAIEIPGFQGNVTKQMFSVFGDDCGEIQRFKVGDLVDIRWVMYAREYNGKLYNNVDLIGIAYQEGYDPNPAPVKTQPKDEPKPAPKAAQKPAAKPEAGKEDDLPF